MVTNATLPPNTRLYAIGDIHGCADLLVKLLDQIVVHDEGLAEIEHKKLVFLGDYIDRGPNSAAVLDILIHHLPKGYETIFLKGNHELMLLEGLENERAALTWLMNGGLKTIASYLPALIFNWKKGQPLKLIKKFQQTLPNSHLRFFQKLQLSTQCGDYFFVHAGVHPDRPLEEQKEQDMLWIRDRFLFSRKNFGKIIIHGHTPAKKVDEAENQIGIDTAAVYGGSLTALMLEGKKRHYLHAPARQKYI